ncbi:RecX family transcriptional regulator [Scopulibacillus cellulosilyticus]|uniref:Regulatory protein RecX n=1 Tax=Scopulibacillus cellulosilyticus TaxID=2665665 RepID=A0ABW2PZ15_9BACL
MYQINKLRADEKNKGYFYVDIKRENDSILTIHVHEDIFVAHELRKGLELTQEKLDAIRSEESMVKIYHLALNYLSYRMRTKKEMEDYLLKKGFERTEIAQIIQRLSKENLLDDKIFAEAFVRSRKRLTTKGPNYILRELVQSGVNEQDARAALDQYSPSEQQENAFKFMNKKMETGSAKRSAMEQKQRLTRLLQQRGYYSETINDIINEAFSQSEEEEWQAVCFQGEKAARKYKKFTGWEWQQKIKQYLFRKGFSASLIERFVQEYKD